MDDLPELKGRISELSPSELFKMVNEEIVEYRKEEIALAYHELERRGLLPKSSNEVPRPIISPLGCLLASALFIVEVFIAGEFLAPPRAAAVAILVSLVSGCWHRPKTDSTPFWKYLSWCAGIVVLGSLAFWDIPNLLRHRFPAGLAFGVPGVAYLIALYWFYESYLPSRQSNLAADELTTLEKRAR